VNALNIAGNEGFRYLLNAGLYSGCLNR